MNLSVRAALLCLITNWPWSQVAMAERLHAVNEIVMWSRQKGSHSDGVEPGRVKPRSVFLDGEELKKKQTNDFQYDRMMRYEGISLVSLLKQYKAKSHDDTAILHFANGMAVKVPLSSTELKRLDAFVAVAVCPERGKCERDFPEVAKEDAYGVRDDPRPIVFSWNKFVVPTGWHPDLVHQGKDLKFSPWRHVDTLLGIEFVNLAAYQRQFDLGEIDGQRVFEQRCAFCHGVRKVGASFGWDVVTPLPLAEKRSPETLYNHVRYPKVLAAKMGLMMPAQTDIEKAEIDQVWAFMKKATSRPLRPYRP